MKWILFSLVVCFCIQHFLAADPDCKAEKDAIKSCVHAIFADAEDARAQRKVAFKACFTSNGCTDPADKWKAKKEAMAKKMECKKNVFKNQLKPKLESCVQGLVPGFTFPNVTADGEGHMQGHWGGHGGGHRGGHRGGHGGEGGHGGRGGHGHGGHGGRGGHDGGRRGHWGKHGKSNETEHGNRTGEHRGKHGKGHREDKCAKREKFFAEVCTTEQSRTAAKACLEGLRKNRGHDHAKGDWRDKKRQVKACYKNHTTAACKVHAAAVKAAICSCSADGLGDPQIKQAIESCHTSTAAAGTGGASTPDDHDEDAKNEDHEHHRKVSNHMVKAFCGGHGGKHGGGRGGRHRGG